VVTGPTNTQQEASGVFVSGTCEVIVPSLIVVLIRDAQTIGSGSCLPSGTFRIFVGLVLGANIIYPRFMTITGDVSSFGDPITLFYDTKNSGGNIPEATSKDDETTGSTTNESSLGILFDYDFVTYTDQQPLKVSYSVSGGKPPYDVVISWGDDSQKKYRVKAAGLYEITHTYKTILPPAQITIQVTDAQGRKAYQSRALVSFRQGVYTPPAQPSVVKQKDWFSTWLIAAVCTLGIILLVRSKHRHLFIGAKKKTQSKKAKKNEKKK
jgi:hypothetical protein